MVVYFCLQGIAYFVKIMFGHKQLLILYHMGNDHKELLILYHMGNDHKELLVLYHMGDDHKGVTRLVNF